MCGIVGVFGGGLTSVDEKVFKQLLQIDTLRGSHSTGVIIHDGIDTACFKKAVDGYTFVDSSIFTRAMSSCHPTMLIGHNRYATAGKVNDANAHPFERGDTCLVHNGSLKTGWRNYLQDSKYTDVDSEAVCYNVHHEGLKATVEKLNGAFMLVSFDKGTQELKLVRNKERPMHFAFHKTRDVVYLASEAEMLSLILNRNDIDYHDICSQRDDAIITYDMNAKNVKGSISVDKEVTYYTPPPATPITKRKTTGSYGGSDNRLSELGVEVDTPLMLKVETCTDYGSITGDLYVKDTGRYLGKGVVYQAKLMDLEKWIDVRCRYFYGNYNQITVTNPATMNDDEINQWEQEHLEESGLPRDFFGYMSPEQDSISKEEFDELVKDGCSMCGDPIQCDSVESWMMEWFDGKSPVCHHCVDEYKNYMNLDS